MDAMQEELTVEPQTNAHRGAAIDMDSDTFRRLGRALVDRVADLLGSLPDRPVSPPTTPAAIRAQLGDTHLPETGTDAATLLEEATSLLVKNSTFNGHPRFFGYITGSAAPIGILGDMLAAAINPNVG
ncbi:MAG TPA: hypothetical protein VJ755_05810, partial [Gemmatimonadales bacterium]|nr:hypothetical protein [Gemmatimonadales bacterium]